MTLPPDTQGDAFRHGRKIISNVKYWVMTTLCERNGEACPHDIYEIAKPRGYQRSENAINIACSILEQNGHLLSTPYIGKGMGNLSSIKMIPTAELLLHGPDPAIYLKEFDPVPYPVPMKRARAYAAKGLIPWFAEIVEAQNIYERRLAEAYAACAQRDRPWVSDNPEDFK